MTPMATPTSLIRIEGIVKDATSSGTV